MKMQNAEMEFVVFDAQDVIATSGELTVTLDNFGDGTTSNGTFTYGDSSYTVGGTNEEFTAFIRGLQTYLGDDKFGGGTYFYKSETDKFTLMNLNNKDKDATKESECADYDGVYAWISKSSYFMKKQ